jgi:hypothetical protein
VTDHDQLAAALESAGLLQDEYPEDMAQRSCTCTPDAICGAHRMLARYDALFTAFQESNRKKREAAAALRAVTTERDALRAQVVELMVDRQALILLRNRAEAAAVAHATDNHTRP